MFNLGSIIKEEEQDCEILQGPFQTFSSQQAL